METPATVVLVHGAWAGSWIWGRVVRQLSGRGIDTVTVDLPSAGEPTGPLSGLAEDEAAVRQALDGVAGETILCGHSYGGMAITGAAADRDDIRRLVYLCAFMPAEGTSLLGNFDGAVPSFWRIRDDLTVVREVDETSVAASDLSPEDILLLTSKRVPHSLTAFTQPPSGVAWRTIPSTYAICTKDASLPVVRQQTFATQATDVVELTTGHHPMLSRPELVTDLLAAIAAKAAALTR
jgi:pimeloyl-ACP methyl ester carboxylesterase